MTTTRRTILAASAGVLAMPHVVRAQGETFRIGALNPVTGAGSPYGTGMQRMIQAAVEAINAAGGANGRRIEVFAEVERFHGGVTDVSRVLARQAGASVEELSELTGRHFTSINIVGGGSQDAYLDELTAAACGLPVFAGPTEGTCLGNLMVQMIATGDLADVQAGRDCIARSFDVKRYEG